MIFPWLLRENFAYVRKYYRKILRRYKIGDFLNECSFLNNLPNLPYLDCLVVQRVTKESVFYSGEKNLHFQNF